MADDRTRLGPIIIGAGAALGGIFLLTQITRAGQQPPPDQPPGQPGVAPQFEFANCQTLLIGNTGELVAAVQTSLNFLGFNAGAVDGLFGNRTLNAVQLFQNAEGITVDGIVGPETFTALDSALEEFGGFFDCQNLPSTLGTGVAAQEDRIPSTRQNPVGDPVVLEQESDELFVLHNDFRRTIGLNELRPSEFLLTSATEKALDLAAFKFFDHVSPRLGDPNEQFQEMFGFLPTFGLGENLVRLSELTPESPEVMMRAWINSPSHRLNLEAPIWERLGVAVVEDVVTGLVYGVAHFADGGF